VVLHLTRVGVRARRRRRLLLLHRVRMGRRRVRVLVGRRWGGVKRRALCVCV